MTKRPLGVTILAWLALAQGVFGLVWPVLLLGAAKLASSYFDNQALGVIGLVVGLFKLIGPLFSLVLAYGAFRLRSWAWTLGIWSVTLSLLGGLGSYLFRGDGWWDLVKFTAIPVVILVYLWTPAVRQAFGKTSGLAGKPAA